MADYPDQGAEMDVKDHPDRNFSDPVFNVPSRDYSKQPASFGEIASATAKMALEPSARIVRGIYDKLSK